MEGSSFAQRPSVTILIEERRGRSCRGQGAREGRPYEGKGCEVPACAGMTGRTGMTEGRGARGQEGVTDKR